MDISRDRRSALGCNSPVHRVGGPAAGIGGRAVRSSFSAILRRGFSHRRAHLGWLCGPRGCEAGKSACFVDREGHQDTIKQGLRRMSSTGEWNNGPRRSFVRTVDAWPGSRTAGFLPLDYRPAVAKALSLISSAVSQDVGACHVLNGDPKRYWRLSPDGLAAMTGERVHDRVSLRKSSRQECESRGVWCGP